MATLSASERMTKARASLIMGHPFFGTLALRLKMVEDPSIETSSCDGTTLKFNPEFVNKLTIPQAIGLIAGEVMHPAMLHHTRRGDRDVKKWNKACDLAIDHILKNAGFDLPNNGLDSSKYKDMSAEHIYTLLPEDPNSNGSGNGDGNNDPNGNGGVGDCPGEGTPSEKQAEEAEWKTAVQAAAHIAKQQGKLPADLERMIDEVTQPIIPWKDILRRFMTDKANDEFTWNRPNRRLIASNIFLPSRYSEGSGEMVVVIDTSGSIGQKELNEFGGEITAIIKDARPSKTYVVYCDARVQHVDEFGPDDDLQFKLHGGGGTDFKPPFRWVSERGIEPKCLVYLTDGYGDFPQDPGYPTMWAINNEQVVPPFGEHLIMVS